MSAHANIATIRRWVDAINRNDIDAELACWQPDGEFLVVPTGATYNGTAQLRRGGQTSASLVGGQPADGRKHITYLDAGDDWACVHYDVHAVIRDPLHHQIGIVDFIHNENPSRKTDSTRRSPAGTEQGWKRVGPSCSRQQCAAPSSAPRIKLKNGLTAPRNTDLGERPHPIFPHARASPKRGLGNSKVSRGLLRGSGAWCDILCGCPQGVRTVAARHSFGTSPRPHALDRPHQGGIHDPVAERLD